MTQCRICGDQPAGGRFDLCPECDGLFAWFLDGLTRDFGEEARSLITPESTFMDLSRDSLDRIERFMEAEEDYGVSLSDLEC